MTVVFASVSAHELHGGLVVSPLFGLLSHFPVPPSPSITPNQTNSPLTWIPSPILYCCSDSWRGWVTSINMILFPGKRCRSREFQAHHQHPQGYGTGGEGSSEDPEDIPCLLEAFALFVCIGNNSRNIDPRTACFETVPSDATSCSDLGPTCKAIDMCKTTSCAGCPYDGIFDKLVECALKEGGCAGTKCGTSQGSSIGWM